MKIQITIEAKAIKKSLSNFKNKVFDNKKGIVLGLVALYCIASLFYITIDVVQNVTNSYIFEGVCTNISDCNLTLNNGMTITFFTPFSNFNKEFFEGNRIKIDCWYSEKRDAWHWASIENLDW